MRRLPLLVVAVVGFTACHYPQLRPASGTALGPGGAAVVEANGVRSTVDASAWSGYPASLPDVLTPIYVAIENRSGRSLRLQYRDFQLKGTSGFRYVALPPFSLSGEPPSPPGDKAPSPNPAPAPSPNPGQEQTPPPGREPGVEQKPKASWETSESGWPPVRYALADESEAMVPVVAARFGAGARITPRFHYYRFYPAPYAHYYIGLHPWPWGYYWYWDPFYYHYYYPYWTGPLPSQDMMERALPEGVVEDGGRVAGFLYFQHVTRREPEVTFEQRLVDAKTGESFGSLSVPFVSK